MSDRMDPSDRVRLAAAWIARNDGRVLCIACGGLRDPNEPPCTCELERRKHLERALDE